VALTHHVRPRAMARSIPRSVTRLAALAGSASFLALGGCSPSGRGPGGDDGGCHPYASTADLSTPVSFATDVVPIFQQSCALSASCHSDPSLAPLQPYLGSSDGGVDAAAILAQIVGVKSAEDPTMDLVMPNDPTNSFLMRKMDGDQCALAQECAGTPYSTSYPDCGALMPQGATDPLPAMTRDIVRAWIKQGTR
jgi:hypothetical protein